MRLQDCAATCGDPTNVSAAPAASPRVAVVIVTYNAHKYVSDCLESVISQHYPDLDLVVVDSGSTDGTADIVREEFPNVRLIESTTNIGYGAGNNLGARSARGDVLVFLNPDAVAEPGWLLALVSGMLADGRNLATSKITLLKDRQRLNTSGNQIHYLGLSFCRGWKLDRSAYSTPELVSGASGAALAITRDLFDRLEGFDEGMFLYHDDVDLSLRALLAGERCMYVPDSVVEHDYELRLSPQKWCWVESHRYAVLLKTYRLPTLLMLLPALVSVELMTLAYLATRGPAYVAAKLASYGWLARNWRAILSARRRAQRLRTIEDRRLLRLLVDRIPFEQLAPAWIARLAGLMVNPVSSAYRRLVISMVRW
jgi:GT2 family glycosyltransferase